MTKKILVLVAIVPALWACGQSPMQSMGTVPSALSANAEGGGSAKFSTRFVQGPNSCPSEAPSLHHPNTHGYGVSLTWNEVPSIHDYYLEIDRYDATNVFMNVATLGASDTDSIDWVMPESGRYRVKIRTHSACDTLGNWSSYEYFSKSGGGSGAAPPPPVWDEDPPKDPPPPDDPPPSNDPGDDHWNHDHGDHHDDGKDQDEGHQDHGNNDNHGGNQPGGDGDHGNGGNKPGGGGDHENDGGHQHDNDGGGHGSQHGDHGGNGNGNGEDDHDANQYGL